MTSCKALGLSGFPSRPRVVRGIGHGLCPCDGSCSFMHTKADADKVDDHGFVLAGGLSTGGVRGHGSQVVLCSPHPPPALPNTFLIMAPALCCPFPCARFLPAKARGLCCQTVRSSRSTQWFHLLCCFMSRAGVGGGQLAAGFCRLHVFVLAVGRGQELAGL